MSDTTFSHYPKKWVFCWANICKPLHCAQSKAQIFLPDMTLHSLNFLLFFFAAITSLSSWPIISSLALLAWILMSLLFIISNLPKELCSSKGDPNPFVIAEHCRQTQLSAQQTHLIHPFWLINFCSLYSLDAVISVIYFSKLWLWGFRQFIVARLINFNAAGYEKTYGREPIVPPEEQYDFIVPLEEQTPPRGH